MSQIRMQNHFGAVKSEERYYIDADLLREIKQVSSAYSFIPIRMAVVQQQKYSLIRIWSCNLQAPLSVIKYKKHCFLKQK